MQSQELFSSTGEATEAGHAYSHDYCRKPGLKALALNYCRTIQPINSASWTVEIVHVPLTFLL